LSKKMWYPYPFKNQLCRIIRTTASHLFFPNERESYHAPPTCTVANRARLIYQPQFLKFHLMEIKSNKNLDFLFFFFTPESESTRLVTLYTCALDICSLLAYGLQLTTSCYRTSLLPEVSGSANQKRRKIRPNLKICHL
jgi:hypothetical protein